MVMKLEAEDMIAASRPVSASPPCGVGRLRPAMSLPSVSNTTIRVDVPPTSTPTVTAALTPSPRPR